MIGIGQIIAIVISQILKNDLDILSHWLTMIFCALNFVEKVFLFYGDQCLHLMGLFDFLGRLNLPSKT